MWIFCDPDLAEAVLGTFPSSYNFNKLVLVENTYPSLQRLAEAEETGLDLSRLVLLFIERPHRTLTATAAQHFFQSTFFAFVRIDPALLAQIENLRDAGLTRPVDIQNFWGSSIAVPLADSPVWN